MAFLGDAADAMRPKASVHGHPMVVGTAGVLGGHLIGPLAAVLVCSQRVAWVWNSIGLLSLHSVPQWLCDLEHVA